jgi:hypothetical protein
MDHLSGAAQSLVSAKIGISEMALGGRITLFSPHSNFIQLGLSSLVLTCSHALNMSYIFN